jgi:hypothetical protein
LLNFIKSIECETKDCSGYGNTDPKRKSHYKTKNCPNAIRIQIITQGTRNVLDQGEVARCVSGIEEEKLLSVAKGSDYLPGLEKARCVSGIEEDKLLSVAKGSDFLPGSEVASCVPEKDQGDCSEGNTLNKSFSLITLDKSEAPDYDPIYAESSGSTNDSSLFTKILDFFR